MAASSDRLANIRWEFYTAHHFESHPPLPGEVQTAVRDAVLAYLGGLDLGQELRWTKLVQIAYDAAPGGVTNVRTILVNGQMRDLEASDRQVIRAGTVVVG